MAWLWYGIAAAELAVIIFLSLMLISSRTYRKELLWRAEDYQRRVNVLQLKIGKMERLKKAEGLSNVDALREFNASDRPSSDSGD